MRAGRGALVCLAETLRTRSSMVVPTILGAVAELFISWGARPSDLLLGT